MSDPAERLRATQVRRGSMREPVVAALRELGAAKRSEDRAATHGRTMEALSRAESRSEVARQAIADLYGWDSQVVEKLQQRHAWKRWEAWRRHGAVDLGAAGVALEMLRDRLERRCRRPHGVGRELLDDVAVEGEPTTAELLSQLEAGIICGKLALPAALGVEVTDIELQVARSARRHWQAWPRASGREIGRRVSAETGIELNTVNAEIGKRLKAGDLQKPDAWGVPAKEATWREWCDTGRRATEGGRKLARLERDVSRLVQFAIEHTRRELERILNFA